MKDPKAIRKAIMTAKSVARLIDPSFGRVPLPELGGFGSQKAAEEHSPMVHAAYGEPMPEHFADGGDVYGDNSKIKVVGSHEGEHRLVPISPKNTNYRHVMEYVPIKWLLERRGNEYRHPPERMAQLRREIEEEGLREPVLLSVGKNSRTAITGEGNHRVLAAHQLGYTHIPVRAMVGDAAGSDVFPEGAHDEDIIPKPNKYFPSEAKPSRVMRSLGYEGQEQLPERWWDEGYAAGGGVGDDQHPYAVPNEQGLYSHAAVTAAGLPQERGTPEQFRGMLLNRGVKPDELKWGEYDYAFGDKPMVSRDEIARHMWATAPEKVVEEELHSRHGANRRPFHEQYTLPGGENYREVLLKHHDEGKFPGVEAHFGGEGDILASLRMKDRKDAEGNKVLHLDELQSDWAQQGRKGFKGSESTEARQALDDYLADLQRNSEHDVMSMWPHVAMEVASDRGEEDKLNNLMGASWNERMANEKRPEEAPYVTKTNDWVDLGLKRALLEAARHGHDRLAWSPGDVQADRYDLSHHISEIRHERNDDGTFNLDIAGPEGHRIYDRDDVPAEKLPEIVGKEMAEKIASGHGEPDENPGYRDWRSLSGLDLKVGGEGMRKFYDELLPKRLMKLAKQHDPEAKFTHSVVPVRKGDEFGENIREEGHALPALEITPQMRESILKHGFAAYAAGGEVEGYADGGEIDPAVYQEVLKKIHSPLSENPESVKRALEIAGSLKHHLGFEKGTGSFHKIVPSMATRDVRSTISDIPGITPKTPIKGSWEDFYKRGKGGVMINMGGDLSNLGRLTHINDKELAWPVDLHAGTKFMLEPNPGYVWGNAAGHSTAFENKIREIEKSGKEAFGVFTPMGPRAVDSAHHMFDALMAQVPSSGADKKDLHDFDQSLLAGEHLDNVIRKDPKKLKAHLDALAAWPGLENAKEASEFARDLSGKHRAMIVQHMEKSSWRKKGLPEVGVTRAAITDPELRGIGGNKIGHRVVKLSSSPKEGSKRAFEHNTYPTYTGGEYVMDVPAVQRHYANPDVMDKVVTNPKYLAKGFVAHPYSEDKAGRDTVRKLWEEQKQLQPVNQRMLDSVMMGMENQEKYGFKKGGSVRRALMIAKGGKKK